MARERIAFYTASLRIGGAERFVVNLSTELIRRGYPVDIVLARAEGPLLEQAPREARIIDLAARHVSSSLPGLVRYLRTEPPVSMLALQTHCNVVALIAQKLAREPARLIVRETNALFPRMRSRFGREAWLLKLASWVYPQAQGIVAVSRGLADEMAAELGLDPSRITTIHNAIVDDRLSVQAESPLEHPWFERGQPPVVLSVGRLVAQKDYATLLRAFALLREHRLARLLILGDGPERGRLQSLVTQLGLEGDVSLPGFEPNPYPFMRHCGVFVLSSAWEGFPNVLVEAMACGAPVVSTDCRTGPAEILENGKYGPLVPVGDYVALSAALGEILDHPILPSVLKDRAADFSVATGADAYLQILLRGPE